VIGRANRWIRFAIILFVSLEDEHFRRIGEDKERNTDDVLPSMAPRPNGCYNGRAIAIQFAKRRGWRKS